MKENKKKEPKVKSSLDYRGMEKELKDTAEAYLRQKFPGVDKEVFYRDYSGFKKERFDISTVMIARDCENLCKGCKDPNACMVAPFLGRGNPAPVLHVGKNERGTDYFYVTWSPEYNCKYNPEEYLVESGLTPSQLKKNFHNFIVPEEDVKNPENVGQASAKIAAIVAATEGKNLILAGRSGTGKTHLAIAICQWVAAKKHIAPKFEVVAEMLDKIRRAIFEQKNYFELIESYKTCGLLVLDDFGKEKQTDAACDYLYQIIDFRYRNELPVVITTNALTPSELASWSSYPENFVGPVISRLLEKGKWQTMKDVTDYRLKMMMQQES